MKKKFGFWFCIGMGAGTSLGVSAKNLPAGIALGIITGLLLALVQTSFAKN
jgi:hypothetical protein